MKSVFLFASVVTLLASCVSLPEATEEDLARTYSQDMRTVFHAVRSTLEELGCEITEGDLKAGYLMGQREGFSGFSDMCMFYQVNFRAATSEDGTLVNADIYVRNCKAIIALRARAYKKDFEEFWQALEANF
jgi:hypothetical protein